MQQSKAMLLIEEWFNYCVNQVCVLSPLLFVIVLEWVMKDTNTQSNDVQWNISTRLDDFDFADDICILAERHLKRKFVEDWEKKMELDRTNPATIQRKLR